MLNKSEINFKVKEIRTIKSPSGKDITSYIVMVNFHDLPSNLSLDVNPRKPKMTTNVAKAIIKAVLLSIITLIPSIPVQQQQFDCNH